MEQIINHAENRESKNSKENIIEINSELEKLNNKLNDLESQYTSTIQNKDADITQKNSEILIRGGLIKFAAKALHDSAFVIGERSIKTSSQDELEFLSGLLPFISENLQYLVRNISQNKNDDPK